MRRILTLITLFSIGVCSTAQITENKKSFIEGAIDGCRRNKDSKIIYESYGKIKGEIILDGYCKCRANYIAKNLTLKQAENIFNDKEKMNEQLFMKMENECTKSIEHLLK